MLRRSTWEKHSTSVQKQIASIQHCCEQAEKEAHLALAQATTGHQNLMVMNITKVDEKEDRQLVRDINHWLAPVSVEEDYQSIEHDRCL